MAHGCGCNRPGCPECHPGGGIEQVEVRFMRSPDDGQCIACNFTVERLVEMLHTGNMVWCFPHTQVAIAAGSRLSGQRLKAVR